MTPLRTARAVLLLLATGTALTACTPGSPAPSGPASLRVVYRVEDTSQQPTRVTTVVVDSGPPYRGRSRTLAGPPPGTTDLGGVAVDEGHQYLLDPGGVRTVQAVPPGFAGTTTGLGVALPAAQRHHLVRRLGTDRVAGRACTQWLSREPLDGGALAPATGQDRTTSCVDAQGLLLRDAWTLRGRVVRTRTAVSVGPGPTLAGSGLLSGKTPAPAPTSAAAEQVRVVSRSVLLKALAVPEPPAPRGLRPDRDAAVLRLDPAGRPAVEGGVLTWSDGRRLAVLRLERGLSQQIAPPSTGVRVQLGGGRSGRLTASSVGLQVTFGLGRIVVTATADLPERDLLAWAVALTRG